MNLSHLVNPVRFPRNVPPDFDPTMGIYKCYGKYAHAHGQPLSSAGRGICLGGGFSGKAYLKKGTLHSVNVTYISKMWHIWNPETLDTFYDEIYPYAHRNHLKPLMGICIPTIIGVYSTPGGRVTVAMEAPHHIGWREADPHISPDLKESILDAYRKIHAQGILHNDTELRHMLIGDDDKITIIDFGISSWKAQPAEFALEMRKIKFVLDYKGAKELEYARMRRAEDRHARNVERARQRRLAKTKEELDLIDPHEFPSEEEIEYPPFALIHLMSWDSEVETEGKPYGPGWRGKRFEIPAHLRNEPYVGDDTFERLPLEPYSEVNFGECVHKALKGEKFVSHEQCMGLCRYSSWLWSPPPMPEVLEEAASQSQVIVPVPPEVVSSEPASGLLSPMLPSIAILNALRDVKAPFSGRKRSRDVHDDEGPPRKKVDVDTQAPASHPSPCQLVVPSDTDSTAAAAALTEPQIGQAGVVDHRESSQSEPETLQSILVSPTTRPSRRPSTSTASRCSVILVDKDDKQKVWSVTKQMLEDIQGYLRIKAPESSPIAAPKRKREQKDEYDASGSDVEASTHPRRKRKSTDEGVQEGSESKRKRITYELDDDGFPIIPGFRPWISQGNFMV